MIYEIINMSDPYTIEAPDLEIALVACVVLGEGQYAFQPLEELDGGNIAQEAPLFLFGGAEQWSQAHFGRSLRAVLDSVRRDRALDLAACFESCVIGSMLDRKTYLAALELIGDDPAKREQWRSEWHDGHRSSMNDIGARALKMAQRLRAADPDPIVDAPQQIFVNRR